MRICVRWLGTTLCVLLMISSAACNMSAQSGPSGSGQGDPELPPIDLSGSPSAGDIVPPEGMDLALCPGSGGILSLKFSADLRMEEGGMTLEHTLSDGILDLTVVEFNDASKGNIQSYGSVAIPFKINGKLGDCTLEGEGSMSASAFGYCKAGVVHLTIIEDWSSGKGEMTCTDEDGSETIPFDIPSPGMFTHSGADGGGEIFYLDNNYSEHSAGYMLEKPFAAGQGKHTWTLLMSYLSPVTPED